MKKALAPLWKKGPLSKSTVSRLVPRLKARWEAFEQRDLAERRFVYLYLDAIALRVRLARKVISVPMMVAVGIDPEGRKELLSLSLWASESGEAWGGFCQALHDRGVRQVQLLMVDGSKGLRTAVATGSQASVPVQVHQVVLHLALGDPIGGSPAELGEARHGAQVGLWVLAARPRRVMSWIIC